VEPSEIHASKTAQAILDQFSYLPQDPKTRQVKKEIDIFCCFRCHRRSSGIFRKILHGYLYGTTMAVHVIMMALVVRIPER
jgi:hypothetical protein